LIAGETGRREPVKIERCPYDGRSLTAETTSGGSVIVVCEACDAAWEWHGAWLRRVREPDRAKLLKARDRAAAPRATRP
jgi:hypothetical protein